MEPPFFCDQEVVQDKEVKFGVESRLRSPLAGFIRSLYGRDYKQVTPQQPAKGAQLVGESPTRRIGRFTTERPGACRAARLRGE